MMTRRQAVKKASLAAAALAAVPKMIAQFAPGQSAPVSTEPALAQALIDSQSTPFTVPPLPYAFDALEPHIDARTMEIHHDKHHGAYVANLNKALGDLPELKKKSVEELLRNLDAVPEKVRATIRNNAGGHYNHSLFWQMMKPHSGGEPTGDLGKAIEAAFGNFAEFKSRFNDSATKVFGSGWVWLTLDGRELKLESSPNQDTPLSHGRQPLLGLDVWEHAYYLKYQNKRADYAAAWWNVVNWEFVAGRYDRFKS